MTSKGRIRRIEKQLNLEHENDPIEYHTLLCVDKERTFEEMVKDPPVPFSSWHNGWLNMLQGKTYLGQTTFTEEPEVASNLRKIYSQAQEKIKYDAKAGGVILHVSLQKDASGKIS